MSTAELNELRKEVKEYIDHADERVVKMVFAMLEADVDADWWNSMPDDVKASVERGLEQSARGEVIPHDDVKKKYPQWFTK